MVGGSLMSGFEIGIIGERYRDAVRLTLESDGIGIHVDGGMGFGGYTVLAPAQCREVADLFSHAADNWDTLAATKIQIEREESALGERKVSLLRRALFGSSS